jgi:hypothetical protein
MPPLSPSLNPYGVEFDGCLRVLPRLSFARSHFHEVWTHHLARWYEADATDLLAWLRREMLPQAPDGAHVQDDTLAWYRARRIEPSPPYSLSFSG